MRFYRIADSRHSPESGEGARLYGGRWNSPGRAVIYACETQSGAMLEKLVHTNGRMPKHMVCVTYEAPESLKVESIDPKAGHIPGAASIPWAQQVREDGTFKSADELTALYAAKGVTGDRDTIAYCRIGERSSLSWFVLHELLGFSRVRNYDGSWTEWGSMVGVPIEVSLPVAVG
jgi:rhodanese-related sulfurtransferase